jgi:hypothetical protein
MDKRILKREKETNVLVKMLKNIINGIVWFVKSPFIILPIFCFIMYAIYLLIEFKCLKDYPYGDYEMVYKVYYTPTNAKTYIIKHNRPIKIGSSKGTNYIYKYNEGMVIQTNAPIEIIKYVNYK